jgi:hypothetical protein
VIKVVSFKPNPNNSSIRTLQTGLVGWVRHEADNEAYTVDSEWGSSGGIADTQLASVPLEVLTAQANYELKLIEAYVLENCSDEGKEPPG